MKKRLEHQVQHLTPVLLSMASQAVFGQQQPMVVQQVMNILLRRQMNDRTSQIVKK